MTSEPDRDPSEDAGNDFAERAASEDPGLIAEFLQFLGEEKKWWLLPILIVLLLFTGLLILGGSSLAPLLYPFF